MRPTEVLTLALGEDRLELEQVAGLEALAHENLTTREDPVWAYLWPSGRALAAVLQAQESLAGQRILEIGCGLGAVGLVAAHKGGDVTLSDLNEEALALAARNRDRNHLQAQIRRFDWNDPPPDLGRYDLILAADVFYGDGMLAGVLRFLRRHLTPGGLALIADPMRIQEGGVAGAGRLHGLETLSLALTPGGRLDGGITLYHLCRRPR